MKKNIKGSNFKTVRQFGNYEVISPTKLPLMLHNRKVAEFTMYYFGFPTGRYEVLTKGKIESANNPLVRIQSACKWGIEFGSQHCDCRWQLEKAKELISKEKAGLIIYAYDHGGKGVGIRNHSLIYSEGQSRGLELVVDAYVQLGFKEDYRDYDDIVSILKHFKIKKIRLLTNSPKRIKALKDAKIEVKRIPLEQAASENPYIIDEYKAKVTKLGHILHFKP
jgi:GTP cyclohydrolase II